MTKMTNSTSPSRFDTEQSGPRSMRKIGQRSPVERLLRWLAGLVAVVAVVSSFVLLCVGATPFLTVLPATLRAWALLRNAPISAVPLLFAGFSYIVLQAVLRPRPLELLKRLMLGSAFLLWGVVQLMPASELATELGNLVIALYVIDLGLMIRTDLQ